MSELAGLWESELEEVVQALKGGAARVRDHEGHEVLVRVKAIDPGRCGENKY